MTKAVKLSVVVPCYNEETRFQKGFNHYYNWLKEQKYAWELVLVDDGSNDGTLKLMENAARQNSSVNVIAYTRNKGKG